MRVLTYHLVTISISMRDHILLCFKDILMDLRELKSHKKLLIDQVLQVVKLMQLHPGTSAAKYRKNFIFK